MVLDRPRTAAFIRVEGTVIARGPRSASAYLAANGQGFTERLVRLGHLSLSAPFTSLLVRGEPSKAKQLLYRPLRKMSEDRIHVLGQEYFEEVIAPQLVDRGFPIISRAKREGHRVVLVSEAISEVISPIQKFIPAVDDVICNQLEYVNGLATGNLQEPVVNRNGTTQWLLEYAHRKGLNLSRCCAFATHLSDQFFLASVGHRTVVNPDPGLRRVAKQSAWRVIDA